MTSPTVPRLLLGPMLRQDTPTSATVWVEVSAPTTVRLTGPGLAAAAGTLTVSGHHYALVVVRDLAPGSAIPYEVHLDDVRVWPEVAGTPAGELPPSVLRTPTGSDPVIIAFGSCRYACPPALAESDVSGRPGLGAIGPDALDALARRRAVADPSQTPDLLLLLGDQVYADETTPATRARIAERRGARSEPRGEVAMPPDRRAGRRAGCRGKRPRTIASVRPSLAMTSRSPGPSWTDCAV